MIRGFAVPTLMLIMNSSFDLLGLATFPLPIWIGVAKFAAVDWHAEHVTD